MKLNFISIGEKLVDNYIVFCSDKPMKIGKIVYIIYKENKFYYKINKIETLEDTSLKISAREVGYYNNMSETDLDLRDVVGHDIFIANKEESTNVMKEDGYM